jgi:DNA-binding CsgD family transcriptional regulator
MARRGVSRETVRTQVRQLLRKLGCRNRREMLVKALEERREPLS